MKPLVKTLCLASLLSCIGFAGSYAGWIENGVPLTHQFVISTEGRAAWTISDGSSGAIIVLQTCREGAGHIIAQHIDSLGAVLWGEEGIDICTAMGDQQYPQIASDGAGGAIVTWQDNRSGNYDIYAQRVNAAGAVQWTADGAALCTAMEDQHYPQITSDGAGGAIITWQDGRSGNSDIYAQRADASGSVLWTADGVALCTATGDQQFPQITSDGAGGAIVTWQDGRSGNSDIYAQRADASGSVQWTADGLALCTATGDQQSPQVTSDGAGGAIVTWQDGRSGNQDIYAQRVDGSGDVQWTADGLALCTATQDQYGPQITSDGAGGAIVAWDDDRFRPGPFGAVYVQRVNASGAVQWTTDGVSPGRGTSSQLSPTIVSDNAGGAIVAWTGDFYGSPNANIYAQRVNASGALQWTADGAAVCTLTGDQYMPTIISDGASGAIVTWRDTRSGNYDIYAQRVNASGAVRWTADGVALCTGTGNQYNSAIASDGAGGAIVAWEDGRNGNYDIYAQRVNASGALQWTADGAALCTLTTRQEHSMIASDGAGGAIVMWQDYPSGNSIFAQRVNASGAVQWIANGVALGTGATVSQSDPQIASDGAGGAIVTWIRYEGGNWHVYAQRVDASGAVQWTAGGVPICAAVSSQLYSQIIPDGAGGAIITWQDGRGVNDVYAQRVNASGALQWPADGVVLCTATGNQLDPQITSDGAGGAIVTWEDDRSGNYDIYAQRVNASGSMQWPAAGVALCAETGFQLNPMITSDGAGGAIVTWRDGRSGDYCMYAQRVNSSGAVQWTTDGVALSTITGVQWKPHIISDGAGGAIVMWSDDRSGLMATYVQRVSASGTMQWIADGMAFSTVAEAQYTPTLASDGAGGTIVAWGSVRCMELVFAQRIRGSGEIVATMLRHYSAAPEGASIRIGWTLSEIDEGARFSILRASAPGWEYIELSGAKIDTDAYSFTFSDETCLPGVMYKYRVVREVEGTAGRILFETDAITMPSLSVTLYQNHPNPFNPRTVIRFYLPEDQEVFLDVYNVAGQRVARLAEGTRERGYHEVTWDGRNSSGVSCSSGVYFSRLRAGKITISRKMVIMR